MREVEALLAAQPEGARENSVYGVYAARIAALRDEPLPPDWDAVHTFDKK